MLRFKGLLKRNDDSALMRLQLLKFAPEKSVFPIVAKERSIDFILMLVKLRSSNDNLAEISSPMIIPLCSCTSCGSCVLLSVVTVSVRTIPVRSTIDRSCPSRFTLEISIPRSRIPLPIIIYCSVPPLLSTVSLV